MESIVIILGVVFLIFVSVIPSILKQRQQEQDSQNFLENIEKKKLQVRENRVETCMKIALTIAQRHDCLTTFQQCAHKMEDDYFSLLENDIVFSLLWDPKIAQEDNPDFCSYIFSVAFYHLFNFESAIKKANITKKECLETMQKKIKRAFPSGYMNAYFSVLMWKKCDLLQERDSLELAFDEGNEDDWEDSDWNDDDWEDSDRDDDDWEDSDWDDDDWEDDCYETSLNNVQFTPSEKQKKEELLDSLLPDPTPPNPVLKEATRIVNLFKCHLDTIFFDNEDFASEIRDGWLQQLNDILKQNPQEILDDFSELETEKQVYLMSFELLFAELRKGKYYFMCDITPKGQKLRNLIYSLSEEALQKNYINQEQRDNIAQRIIDTVEEYRVLS